MLVLVFYLCLLLSIMLIFVNSAMGVKLESLREKLSAFECGFDPKTMARMPFSLHFFLIALIFLIFDVEITLILPIPVSMSICLNQYLNVISVFFVTILILGTLMEWVEGSLDWSY